MSDLNKIETSEQEFCDWYKNMYGIKLQPGTPEHEYQYDKMKEVFEGDMYLADQIKREDFKRGIYE